MLCLPIEINYVYPSKYLVMTSLSWFPHFRIHLFIYSHNEMVLELTNRKLRVRSDSNSSL